MSLINDALKKAQKQRTGEALPLASMPSIGGESATRIAKRAKPSGFNSLLLRLGLGAGSLLLLVIAGCIILRVAKKPAAPTLSSAPFAGSSQSAVPGNSQPSTSNSQPPGTNPTTTFNLPIAAPVSPAPESSPVPATPVVTKDPKPVATVAATPAPPTPATVPAKTAGPSLKLDNKVINYIESLRIAGIRASATDSKVLMSDRVYRVGDIVEHEMGLKLIAITSGSLTFEDERGARYTRTF